MQMPLDETKPSPLVGTWRLVSTEQRLRDGTVQPSPIYGPNGVGYLIYGSAHRMCALLMNPNRPHWLSADEPTPQEMKSAIEGFVAYCGSYEVNEAEGFVLHHVEVDQTPNWVGTDLKRCFVLSGNRLTLRPAPPLPAGVVDYTLTWERV
jgi:hypothetical protein